MKGLATVAVLGALSTAEASSTMEDRLDKVMNKFELHKQKSRLLNELQSVDKKIHALEMADAATNSTDTSKDTTSNSTDTTASNSTDTTATNSTDTTATNSTDTNSTDANSTKAADADTSSGSSGIIIAVVVAVVAGAGALWWFKFRKSDDQSEGGEVDDKYAKFIDNELANWDHQTLPQTVVN